MGRKEMEALKIEVEGVNYPYVIYHPEYSPMIVKDKDELISKIGEGWRMSPVQVSAKEVIISKIKWHEHELEGLYVQLDAIEKSETEKIKVPEGKDKSEIAGKNKLICYKCGKECKTEEGLNIHMKQCKGKDEGNKEQ